MIERIVGNYKIIQALGEGGVGMVYKGVDTMLDREVAIKVLRPELASQTAVVERFRSEAVTLAKLSHPNIATLFSLFRDGQDLIMVLEFIKGETLDHTLYRQGKIPADEAIPIFCQALEGINYAHKLGIVHRDIKPGNMMLTEDGIVKVLDFGIARLLGSARMTRVGNVIGTLEYMSPEQVRGLETDARSDVYGLGIMLYEMLAGRLPFESENDFALMKMQIENMPVPPRQVNPDIPLEVEEAIMKSVAKDPNQRFQSAGDFLDYFLEIGFALPNTTFYGKKKSRPSNPGIQSREVAADVTLQMPNNPAEVTLPMVNVNTDETLPMAKVETEATLQMTNLPPSQIPTAQIISKPQIPVTLEVGEEIKKEKIGETRLAPNQSEVKGTRLAAPIAPVQNEIKATRLGAVETQSDYKESSPSFFSKLNWIHYTGAGVVGLFLLTLITTAAVLPFVWGGGKENPTKIELNQPTNPANPPTTPVNQPVAKEEPPKQPSSGGGGLPVAPSDSVSSSNTNPGTAITPIPNESGSAANTAAVPKQPKERETVRNQPPPAQPQQPKPAAPKPQPPRNSGGNAANTARRPPSGGGGGAANLRNILTDN